MGEIDFEDCMTYLKDGSQLSDNSRCCKLWEGIPIGQLQTALNLLPTVGSAWLRLVMQSAAVLSSGHSLLNIRIVAGNLMLYLR